MRGERHLRLHLGAATLVVAAGAALGVGPGALAVLVLAIALVLLAELANTVVERLCDLVQPRRDPAVGRLKDLAAGSVLLAAAFAAAVGGLELVPALLHRLGG